MSIELILLGWFVCGIVGAGLMFGYFQREHPRLAEEDYKRDFILLYLISILGPINLVASIIFLLITRSLFKHGFKFW